HGLYLCGLDARTLHRNEGRRTAIEQHCRSRIPLEMDAGLEATARAEGVARPKKADPHRHATEPKEARAALAGEERVHLEWIGKLNPSLYLLHRPNYRFALDRRAPNARTECHQPSATGRARSAHPRQPPRTSDHPDEQPARHHA